MNKKINEIIKEVHSDSNFELVKNIINQLSPDPVYGPQLLQLLNERKPETRTFLSAITRKIKPKTYLEIGTRRGWSMAVVAKNAPKCEIFSFDEWHEKYGGVENPGPEFVKEELKRINCDNKITFINGNSHVTLKEFFKDESKFINLVLVDGDHTVDGAREDLMDVMSYISVGGVIVFDDIVSCARLDEVWDEMEIRFPQFEYYTYMDSPPGVGFALRTRL